MPYKDREKHLQYNRDYNKKHKKRKLKQIRKNNIRRSKIIRQKIIEIKKKSKCRQCGESDPRCLDFHHRNARMKKYDIALLPHYCVSPETFYKEIEKCDILCSNCHRKITLKRFY